MFRFYGPKGLSLAAGGAGGHLRGISKTNNPAVSLLTFALTEKRGYINVATTKTGLVEIRDAIEAELKRREGEGYSIGECEACGATDGRVKMANYVVHGRLYHGPACINCLTCPTCETIIVAKERDDGNTELSCGCGREVI